MGGIPQQIEDGIAGFIINLGDAIHMADRIEKLLSDDGLRKRMGVQAGQSADKRFDLNRQVEDYLGLYYEILENWHSKKG